MPAVRTWKAQKAGLTRVVNKLAVAQKAKRDSLGRDFDGKLDEAIRFAAVKVLDECKRVVRTDWADTYWPDDWHRWNIALGDAAYAYRRADGPSVFPDYLEDLR